MLLFLRVDNHKDSLAACLVDQTGVQLTAATFLNTPDGHGDLLAWVGRSGQLTRAGIEGAANLGAGMARLPHQQGLDVCEVGCTLTVRERRRLRRPGKSDPTDALAIARNTAAGLLEPVAATAGSGSVRAQLAQRRIVRLRQLDDQLDEQIAACLTQLTKLVAATRTQLVDIVGIGPLLAARILGEVGDIQRFPTRDHFASANGTAPIPVSSGRTDRHRLNRGGNRRLNRALYFARSPRPATTRERAPNWPVSRPRQDPPGSPALSHWASIGAVTRSSGSWLLGRRQGTAPLLRRQTASFSPAAPGAPRP